MNKNKKTCSVCGTDLSRWNLDFSREIICGNCLMGPSGNPEKKKQATEIEIDIVKKVYNRILDREKVSHAVIACLEKITNHDFKRTKDFCEKMDAFIKKHYYKGVDLRRALNWSGMTVAELADWFEVSVRKIMQMMTNKKPLSEDAIAFIKVMRFKKTIPLKKLSKTASKGCTTHIPKNEESPPEKKTEKTGVSDFFKCWRCKKIKDRWDITIELLSPYHHEFVCEDCLSRIEADELSKAS